MVLVSGGQNHISYVPYLLITKRGRDVRRDVGVVWHGLRGRQDCFIQGDDYISTFLLRLGKFVQDRVCFVIIK